MDTPDFIHKMLTVAKCGADIIQIRSKKMADTDLIKMGKELHRLLVPFQIPIIINDNPYIALESGAEGVHLGRQDYSLENIPILRKKGLLVGVSVYGDIKMALTAQKMGADYVAFSSPFPSPTKPEKTHTSIKVLKKAACELSIPVFVIGGINNNNISKILAAGINGVAVISYIFSGDICQRVKILKRYLIE